MKFKATVFIRLRAQVMEDWSFEITEVDSFPRGVSEVG